VKTIGLIGGLSWQSTVEYYRIINEESGRRLGGNRTAQVILYSVSLEEMLGHMERGEKELLREKFVRIGQTLKQAGAQELVLCTNTMHAVCDGLEQAVGLPFLHIADATAAAIKSRGFTKVGLLGTPFTMGQHFYKGRLWERHGIQVITPPEEEFPEIYRVITEELTFHKIKEASRAYYLSQIEALARRGAQGVILGCTEIPLLIQQQHTPIPVFDTTTLHALAAVELADRP